MLRAVRELRTREYTPLLAHVERYPYLREDSLYRGNTSDFTKRTITPVMASLAELLRNTPKYEEHYEWFVDLAKNFHNIQMEMVVPKNEFAVICHGDLWLSNILFKYGAGAQTGSSTGNGSGNGSPSSNVESSGNEPWPTEVKFIDFQSARFASLATDLLLFLFTSVRVSFFHPRLIQSRFHPTTVADYRKSSLPMLTDIFLI